ncbi:MAG: biotin transporter BioY [Rickettsiaceae bacterium]|nr:biotin transporter BioY [Rickettsiaceae bacterium]
MNYSIKIQTLIASKIFILKIFLGILLLAACAQMSIPFYPVPITFQTLAILLISFLYSPKEALITLCSYVLIGILGAPIFSSFGFGLIRILGPSGGYIIGFIFAASISSYIFENFCARRKTMPNILMISIICHSIIYFFGLSHLLQFISLDKCIYYGFIIFIPTDIIKTLVFTAIFSVFDEKNN